MVAATSQEVADLYKSCLTTLESSKARIKVALRSFVDANDNPSTSSNYSSTEPDPIKVFVAMLENSVVQQDSSWMLLLLRALKILSRKRPNRLAFGSAGLRAIAAALVDPVSNKIAAEGANVLLNVCYEPDNVQALLETPCVQQLLLFLMEDDEELQANAAGAIQSICFQEGGRRQGVEGAGHVYAKGGIPALSSLLESCNSKVVSRAAGAIHNLSSSAEAIRDVRTYGALPTLVSLLQAERLGVAASAAGALQNVSREVASRLVIRDLDAVPPLARLLSASDVQAQVCASGALLNIIGPDLDSAEYLRRERAEQRAAATAVLTGAGGAGGAHATGEGAPQPWQPSQRRGLGRLMALCMATSAIYDSLFDAQPELPELPPPSGRG
ncbi:hypothetical protein GPECTOR_17g954 [Gonium pectorale]|uniref:Armadillo repeat-containing domain-containing protein n=1 Tax=Gonium pectorale TaxID=33097 RepID=A0A150GKR1_GONPE|nr:hypothetical protein GPECTOR_17g954 [Gonium pectorale]|eukprot:KXZ50315.1 hypothetical protein GPECTOR_17g954 [Gonium pectorale]